MLSCLVVHDFRWLLMVLTMCGWLSLLVFHRILLRQLIFKWSSFNKIIQFCYRNRRGSRSGNSNGSRGAAPNRRRWPRLVKLCKNRWDLGKVTKFCKIVKNWLKLSRLVKLVSRFIEIHHKPLIFKKKKSCTIKYNNLSRQFKLNDQNQLEIPINNKVIKTTFKSA